MPRRHPGSGSELARLQERLTRLLEQATLGGEPPVGDGEAGGGWRPVLDLLENEEGYLLVVELPGVAREDVRLEAVGRSVELSGQRRPAASGQGFLRLEGHYGPFRRRVELPSEVDPDAVQASLRGGLLEVRLPKVRSTSRVLVEEG